MTSANDPIADVIGLLRPRTSVSASLWATGAWAVRFDPYPHVKFGSIAQGQCWLAVGDRAPILLRQGDVFLLGNPPRYVLASDLAMRPRSAKALWAHAVEGKVRLGRDADETTLVCGGHFAFDDPNAALLLDVLPTVVHVRAGDPRGTALSHLGQLLVAEASANAPGGSLVMDRLAQIVLVHMLRAHADDPGRPAGWLGALGHARIGPALRAMHADVSRRWTLDDLAGVANMSRSAFAAAFKSQVGSAPLEYLIQWRMSLARDALRRESHTISELAFAIGYESESAFSTAFRRVVGASPKQYRQRERAHAHRPRVPTRERCAPGQLRTRGTWPQAAAATAPPRGGRVARMACSSVSRISASLARDSRERSRPLPSALPAKYM